MLSSVQEISCLLVNGYNLVECLEDAICYCHGRGNCSEMTGRVHDFFLLWMMVDVVKMTVDLILMLLRARFMN
jgi:hypothetical protein